MSDKTIVSFKWSDVRSLILVWGFAIILSIGSLGVSIASFYSDRKEWSCLKDGHGFSGRYNNEAIDEKTIKVIGEQFSYSSEYRLRALDLAKKSVYVRDVCTYCGETKELSDGTLSENTR